MKKLFFIILGLYFSILIDSCLASNVIDITFNKVGAIYLPGEPGWAICKTCKANDNDNTSYDVHIVITDIEGQLAGYDQHYILSGKFEHYYYVPFQMDNLGYYYLKVSLLQGDTIAYEQQLGFGVVPDVKLTSKDYESPFGVGAHYARYGDWRVAGVQQSLGIAWLRDNGDWKKLIAENYTGHDPFIDYLDAHNLCWLPILNYVEAANGWLDENGIWRWDDDVSHITRYVRQNSGKICVYESQNEPSNFAGWSKRWPHPQGQKWRPQGWGVPFTDLVKQIHDSVKAVDKNLLLMWPGEEEWIEYFVDHREGVPERIDLTAIHPYVLWNKYPETAIHAKDFYKKQKAMLQERNVPTDIWVTETGWTTYTPDSIKRHFPYVTELEQAQFLVRTYLLQLYNGAGKIFWYELVEEPFGATHPESGFGLLRYNSMLTVKPAAVAYANLIYNYRYLVPVGKYVGKDKETYGLLYTDPTHGNVPVLSMWRKADKQAEIIPLEYTKKLTATDIFGRNVEIRIIDGKAHIPLSMSVLTIKGFDQRDVENFYTLQRKDKKITK